MKNTNQIINTALTDEDEWLDIVDGSDAVVGTILRSQSKTIQAYYRCVLAFIVDQHGRLCFLRRSPTKSYPRAWAVVGGCVQSGESYDAAFAREVLEEANIDVAQQQVRHLGVVTPHEFASTYFKSVYEIRVNSEHIAYAPDVFCEYQWLYPHQVSAETMDLYMTDIFYLTNRFYGQGNK